MASSIDDTIPVAETTIEAEPIRANFEAAKSEIEALQAKVSRSALTADTTYYVSVYGDDTHDGLSSGTAFRSIQKAVNVACALDTATYQLTIQIEDGTYSENVVIYPHVGNLPIRIQGNASTPGNVVVSATTICFLAGAGVRAQVRNLKTTTSGTHQYYVATGGYLEVQGLNIGSGGYQLRADDGGAIVVTGNYTISAGGAVHWMAIGRGSIKCQSKTVTLSGTPAFTYFAYSGYLSTMFCEGCTFSGSATGTRYIVDTLSTLYTGSTSTYFPGNASGSTSNGGLYL